MLSPLMNVNSEVYVNSWYRRVHFMWKSCILLDLSPPADLQLNSKCSVRANILILCVGSMCDAAERAGKNQ